MSLITIDQLLESVDLDFVPRFVTKDADGEITIYSHRPTPEGWCAEWREYEGDYNTFGKLKLSEFANTHWTKCIYEVPRKTTGKIEHIKTRKSIDCSDRPEAHIEKHRIFVEIWDKINELVDAVNELKGGKE